MERVRDPGSQVLFSHLTTTVNLFLVLVTSDFSYTLIPHFVQLFLYRKLAHRCNLLANLWQVKSHAMRAGKTSESVHISSRVSKKIETGSSRWRSHHIWCVFIQSVGLAHAGIMVTSLVRRRPHRSAPPSLLLDVTPLQPGRR